jgi:hypothetical protein
VRIVPCGVEQVRPEVADQAGLLGGGQQLQVVQREPDGHAVGRLQNRSRLVRRALPAHPGPVEVPGAVHPEVAVQAAPVIEPREQVLSDAAHLQHGATGQVVPDQARVA